MDGAAWASTCCDRYLPAAPPWRDSGDIRLSPTLAQLEVDASLGLRGLLTLLDVRTKGHRRNPFT
jgi:hypothetical protein